jgi:desulfoferrodoxin (superoxide reductase-like protein)
MPMLAINGTKATVTVNHGMSSVHFIDTIYVRDQNGAVVHMKKFNGSEASAQTAFEVPSGATTLTAYEHCNLHGLWAASPQTVAWEQTAAQFMAAQAQGGLPFNELHFPEGWSGKVAGHMPMLAINGNKATVTVNHSMSSVHFIDTIYVRDQNGAVVHMKKFDGSEASAQTAFEVPSGATTLTAYEHCNLHGLWAAAPQTMAQVWLAEADALESKGSPFNASHLPVVQITVSLSLAGETVALFTADKREAFRRGFAAALNVSVESVQLSVSAAGGARRLSEGIVLTVTVTSSSSTVASAVQAELAAPAIDGALVAAAAQQGLTIAAGNLVVESKSIQVTSAPAAADHIPVLVINGAKATVTVNHGMSSVHFIDTIYVRDQNGAVVHMKKFDGSETSAQTAFEVPPGATTLTAYEHCNLHGLWAASPQKHSASIVAPSTVPPAKKPRPAVASFADKDIKISWGIANSMVSFTVDLNRLAWVGIAFSKAGRMVFPAPSRAVVGTVDGGVRKRTLQQQEPNGVAIDAVQDLIDPQFSQQNGQTTMSFTVTTAYATSLADASGNTHIIFAFGDSNTFAFHDERRGSFPINFGAGAPTTTIVSSSNPTKGAMCNDPAISYELGLCYLSYSSTQKADYDPIYKTFDHHQHLSAEFLLAWSVVRGEDGYISIMMSARSLGWLGFGLMSDGVKHGMINTDMWFGTVENGRATVLDSYAFSIAPPVADMAVVNGTQDLYDIQGSENAATGMTTIMFKRKLKTTDPNDYDIKAGPMSTVFAFNRQNSDLLTSYHGPTRGFSTITFFEPLTPCTELDYNIQFESCDLKSGMKKCSVTWKVPDVTKRACSGELMAGPKLECDYVPWQSGSAQVVIAAAAFSIAIALVISSWVLRNGDLPILKAAQRPFCLVFCCAAILLNLAMLLQLGPNTAVSCQARIWLFNLSFTLMFAALFTKVHRAYKILTNPTLKKIRMTDMQLYRAIGLIVGTDLMVLAAWNIAKPYVPSTTESLVQGFSQLVDQRTECATSAEFVGLSIIYKAVLLLWGCWLSWHGRQISDTYSESKQMLFVIYGISGQATIVLLVSFTITGISQGNVLMVQGIVVSWSIVAALTAIFWPKFRMRSLTQLEIVESATCATAATSATKVSAAASTKSTAASPKTNANKFKPNFSAVKIVPINSDVEKDQELQILCNSIEQIMREPHTEALKAKLQAMLISAQTTDLVQKQKTQHM